jgi:hypothetical protein
MSYRYIPSAAGLTVWGIVLFVAGGVMSGWMAASAVRESFLAFTSVFYSSDADVYTGFAVLFALVSIAGFVLLAVGVSRAVKRADQRYDGWFRTLHPGHVQQTGALVPAPHPAAAAPAPGPIWEQQNAGIPPLPSRGPSLP